MKTCEDRYNKAYGAGLFTVEQLREYTAPLQEKISSLRRQLANSQQEANAYCGEMPSDNEIKELSEAARSTLQNLNLHARRAILVNTVEKIVGTQQKLGVYGCIPIRNHIELCSSDRHRLNVDQHAHSLTIPFQLQIQLPPPRTTRNIVDRDEAGRIVRSVPPMADRSDFRLAAQLSSNNPSAGQGQAAR